MKYVVARPAGDLSKIFILSEGADVPTPFESWALREGKQILFATTKMHKVLHSHHFAGSYEQGAMYAYTYVELCAILTAHLGPSDKARYEAGLKAQSQVTLIREPNVRHNRFRTAYIMWKITEFVLRISLRIFAMLAFFVILPVLMGWIDRTRK